MPVRILHTADNHIGIPYQRYKDAGAVHDRLVAERTDALRRLVVAANERQAHFFVVAGDLFDRPSIPQRDVESTVNVLREFTGEAVLVLPGNHDFYDGPSGKLWTHFRNAAAGSTIRLLAEQRAEEFEIDGQAVRFFPCPCPSKHGEESLIGWVAAVTKEANTIHIGIAHGNVAGLSLDAEGRYFTMRQDDLRAAGMATWLLGHVHVPFPAAGSGGSPAFFMPGIHTPDSVKCRHPGHAWCIDVEAGGVVGFEQVAPAAIRFVRISVVLRTAADIEGLQRGCGALTPSTTVLDLQLTGRLRAEDRHRLDQLVCSLRESYLFVTCEESIAHELDKAELARLYPTGTLAHRLLDKLLDDEVYPDAAWLAHELFQAEKQA